MIYLDIIFSWYLYHFIEYVFHRVGHYNHKYNYIYHLHKRHHTIHYPITRLTSTKYEGQGEGIVAFLPPFLVSVYICRLVLSSTTFYCFCWVSSFLIIVSEYIHTNIHLKDSHLERFTWFKKLRNLHHTHHRKLTKNYSFGGLSYRIDKFAGTYLDTPTHKSIL